MPNTVRLHRVLTTKPDKVYRAFIEADAMAKWLPPNGFTCTVHHFDAKVGGTFKMSFRNFTTGLSHSFGGDSCPASACATPTNSRIPSCPRNPGDGDTQTSIRRHGGGHRARRYSRRDSGGSVLYRLAAVA